MNANILTYIGTSFGEIEDSIKDEFFIVAETLTLREVFFKTVEVEDGKPKANLLSVYDYYDADLEENIFMVVEMSIVKDSQEFKFGEFLEPGGFDSLVEVENFLNKTENVLKI